VNLEAVPVRVERRLGPPPRWLTVTMPFVSVVLSLVLAAVVLAVSGNDPVAAYRGMVRAAFTNSGALSSTLASATPLLLTGLAAAFAFRMKAWNIGGEGQLYIGAICAAAVGFAVGSHGLAAALPAMLLAAVVGGALWAAVPGLLRAYLRTNEILTSLMLNYLAGLLLYYLIYDSSSYWRDLSTPAGRVFPQSKQLDPSAFWPTIFGGWLAVPSGFVVGVALAVALHVTIRHTRFGFQLRVISDSPAAGRYAGMQTKRIFVAVMLISGALAGLAGANEVGTSHLLNATGLQQAQFGYTGIVVAALVRYNPLGVIAGAFCLGAITNAGFELQGATFPPGLVGTIEGIMLFCVLGGEALIRYRVTIGRTGWTLPAQAEQPPEAIPVTAGDSPSGGAK
jgi:simple sugar transport system permease protein